MTYAFLEGHRWCCRSDPYFSVLLESIVICPHFVLLDHSQHFKIWENWFHAIFIGMVSPVPQQSHHWDLYRPLSCHSKGGMYCLKIRKKQAIDKGIQHLLVNGSALLCLISGTQLSPCHIIFWRFLHLCTQWKEKVMLSCYFWPEQNFKIMQPYIYIYCRI